MAPKIQGERCSSSVTSSWLLLVSTASSELGEFKNACLSPLDLCWVLIFCVEFRELSHSTRDLSQAEQMHKMTSISLKMVEVVILSENSSHFVSCLACNNIYFLLSLREVMCWTNTKNEGLCFPISCMIVFSLKDTRLPHATLAGQAAGIYFSFTILHTYFVVYLLYKTQLQYFCYIVTLSYT